VRKKRRKKNKPQHENIMVCPIPYGDDKYETYEEICGIAQSLPHREHCLLDAELIL